MVDVPAAGGRLKVGDFVALALGTMAIFAAAPLFLALFTELAMDETEKISVETWTATVRAMYQGGSEGFYTSALVIVPLVLVLRDQALPAAPLDPTNASAITLEPKRRQQQTSASDLILELRTESSWFRVNVAWSPDVESVAALLGCVHRSDHDSIIRSSRRFLLHPS